MKEKTDINNKIKDLVEDIQFMGMLMINRFAKKNNMVAREVHRLVHLAINKNPQKEPQKANNEYSNLKS